MKSWCEVKALSSVKGCILPCFTITDIYIYIYMKLHYGKADRNEKLDEVGTEFDTEEFPSEHTITIFNPIEGVILLIREAKDENVENELKFCGVEMKMLVMLLGSELKESGVKIIPRVVTDEEGVCTSCKNYLISKEDVKEIKLFNK